MPRKSAPKERIHRLGLADPRGAAERFAAVINRAASKIKGQDRRYDDSPSKRARNLKASATARKARGESSKTPTKKGSRK